MLHVDTEWAYKHFIFTLLFIIPRTVLLSSIQPEAETLDFSLREGGGVTCICHDTGMCHYFGYFFGGCSRIFGYHFWLFPDIWVSFFGRT